MPTLSILVPTGTANAHTAQERYEHVMSQFEALFPETLLSDIGEQGTPIQVKELTAEQVQWLKDRRAGWTIEGFTYNEYSHTHNEG